MNAPLVRKVNETTSLWPFHLSRLGGKDTHASQCMIAGDNFYKANRAAYNNGLNDHWVRNNTPHSWGYFKRADLPVHFALAEGWTIADMYQESVIASTNPNRVALVSGSINVPGGPQKPEQGGVYIDNDITPGMGCLFFFFLLLLLLLLLLLEATKTFGFRLQGSPIWVLSS